MDKRTSARLVAGQAAVRRLIRGFAVASLGVLGVAFVVLLIGTPLALLARGVHDVLSWLAQSRGETSALIDAFVSVATVVVSVIVVAAGVRLLVGFFNWRRRLRTRGSSRNGAAARSIPHGTGRAA